MDQEGQPSWILADAPTYHYAYMFNSLTGQDASPVYGWMYPFEDIREKMESGAADYMILLYGTGIYEENREYLNTYEMVIENGLGCVIAL